MVQTMFYDMVVDEALELGVLSRSIAEDLKFTLICMWGFIFKV